MRTRGLLALVWVLVACGSSKDDEGSAMVDAQAQPQPTSRGAKQGDVETTSVDAGGGMVQSADGRLQIIFPAGALAKATDITIAEISNTAHGGVGTAYRLGPEGSTFDKPVELRIAYVDEDVADSAPAALGIATQNADKFWEWLESAVDENKQFASASTTHFSDFSLVKGFQIRPHDRQLETDEAANFVVTYCYDPNAYTDTNELGVLGYECDIEEAPVDLTPALPVAANITWAVNGKKGGNSTLGTISGDAIGKYHAPSKAPDPNTVTVSGEFAWGMGKQIVTAEVTIGQVGKKYKGQLDYSIGDGTNTYTLSGTVTWTPPPGTLNMTPTYSASGALHAEITLDGCSPYSGEVDADGALDINVPDDGYYAFSIGTSEAILDCNGVEVPYQFLIVSPPCAGSVSDAPQLGDGTLLSGSGGCLGDGESLSWSFELQP